LRIRSRDGCGRSLGKWIDCGYDLWLRLGLSLPAGAPVARLCLSAAGAHPTQLLGDLLERM
jgi:hypothetical protein